MEKFDAIVIGAGAAGLMCAAVAGQRGRRILLIDHAKKAGEKIRISGGGRCNFTNMHAGPSDFLSTNPHFCKSALKRYTQWDFIDLVDRYGISHHEKTLGQLFCDESSQQIIDMMLEECRKGEVEIHLNCSVDHIQHECGTYNLETTVGHLSCDNLIVATGGKSIPKMGATGFGYDVAQLFGLKVTETRAGLVPFRFGEDLLKQTEGLSGLSVDATVSYGKTEFSEGLLFTHRGLSGPSILQISSYWQEGDDITVNLAPGQDVYALLKQAKQDAPKQSPQTVLAGILPKRLAQRWTDLEECNSAVAELSDKKLESLARRINQWTVKPSGTEGYRTAEVTLGGVDTDAISSKTFECKQQPGLYFIGEVLDVTGHLGGFNFQWAWASGYCAGQFI